MVNKATHTCSLVPREDAKFAEGTIFGRVCASRVVDIYTSFDHVLL